MTILFKIPWHERLKRNRFSTPWCFESSQSYSHSPSFSPFAFVPGHFLFSLSSFSPAKIAAAEFLHGRNQGMRVDGKSKCSALRNRKMRTVAYGRRRWRRRQRRRLRGRWPVKLRPRAYTLWPCCLAHSFVKRKFTCIDRLVLFLLVELGASIV